MTIITNQSAINEVRDQMSLDHADGSRLNNVTGNLGLSRPPFGFDDATWRAIAKVLALQHKQIRTKFEDVLSILYGPKTTQVSSLAEDAAVGDTMLYLTSTDGLPQVGTVVLDEGLVNEETIRYIYINRSTNVMYLEEPLTNTHTALEFKESALVHPAASGQQRLSVFDGYGWPTGRFTVVIGRGTEYEQVSVVDTTVTAIVEDAGYIDLDANLSVSVPAPYSKTSIVTDVVSSVSEAYHVVLDEVDSLPLEGGYILFSATTTMTVSTATGATQVQVADALTVSRYGGYRVVFLTGLLAGEVGYVYDNTANTFLLSNSLSGSPTPGDTFALQPFVQYNRAVIDDDSILLRREFPNLRTVTGYATLYEPAATCAVGQVQVKAGGWDVIQTDLHNVEILLPENVNAGDLRSASYVHEVVTLPTSTTTATNNEVAGATTIEVGSTTVLITSTNGAVGVASVNGGTNGYFTYVVPHTYLTADVAIGATSLSVLSTENWPTTGTLIVDGETTTYTIVDSTTITVAALAADHRAGSFLYDSLVVLIPTEDGLPLGFTAGDTIRRINTNTGSLWEQDATWPGPYVYDYFSELHADQTQNAANRHLSGPVRLMVDSLVGTRCLEVEDASAFELTAFPYDIVVGELTGNAETLTVTAVALRQRTYTTAAAGVTAGDTSIQLTALTGALGPNYTFPTVGTYRIFIDDGTYSEVLEATGTATGPDRILLSSPAVNSYIIGANVYLLNDTLTLSIAADDNHQGVVSELNKTDELVTQERYAIAELVRPVYTSVVCSSPLAGFEPTTGTFLLNFGKRWPRFEGKLASAASAGATSLILTSTSALPSADFIVTVGYGMGRRYEDRVFVTANNTGTATLTISHGLRAALPADAIIVFEPGEPEEVSYYEASGSTIEFSPSLIINYTHYMVEPLSTAAGSAIPRVTGFDFPLRAPYDESQRLQYLIDLIRAAGVQVTLIDKR